jgi:ABC-type glycerol-3-phosphate transport system permease component
MLDAYIHAWTALDMPHLLKNSLLLASGGVLVSLVIAFPISFLVARRRILFANGLFIFFLVGLMVPQQMVILPLYRIADSLRLSGTLLGLIAVHGVYGIPFAMLILRSYFANIPESLDEAARIDGCGDFGVLLRIVAPLSIPGLSTVAALQFMNIWNEFLFSVVLLTDSNDWPVTVGVLPVMLSQYFVSWNLPAATLVIAQLPTILIFVLGQRWVVKGITAGAVRD